MTVKVTLEFPDMAAAAAFLNGHSAPAKSFNDPLPAAMQAPSPAPAPIPMQQTMQQPMPPVPAPAAPAPAPAPAPAAGGVQYNAQTLGTVLQQFATLFKPAGLKASFQKFGLPAQISALDQNGMNIMGDYATRCIAAQQLLPQ